MVKFVRDGQLVWPYCEECESRLEITYGPRDNESKLLHFWEQMVLGNNGCSKRFDSQIVPNYKVAAYI